MSEVGLWHRNLQVRKETRTNMESATFRILETVLAISLAIIYMSEIDETYSFYNNAGAPTMIHPLGQPNPRPQGECFAPFMN